MKIFTPKRNERNFGLFLPDFLHHQHLMGNRRLAFSVALRDLVIHCCEDQRQDEEKQYLKSICSRMTEWENIFAPAWLLCWRLTFARVAMSRTVSVIFANGLVR